MGVIKLRWVLRSVARPLTMWLSLMLEAVGEGEQADGMG